MARIESRDGRFTEDVANVQRFNRYRPGAHQQVEQLAIAQCAVSPALWQFFQAGGINEFLFTMDDGSVHSAAFLEGADGQPGANIYSQFRLVT